MSVVPRPTPRAVDTVAVVLAAISLTALLLASTTTFAFTVSSPGDARVTGGGAIPTGWAVIAGRPGTSTRFILRLDAVVEGSICAQQGQLGPGLVRGADIVATGAGSNAWRLRASAVVDGDVVTGGGGVRSLPRGSDLPGVGANALAGGVLVDKDDGSGVYDTTGADPRVSACANAQAAAAAGGAVLGRLVPDSVLGKLSVPGDATLTVGTPLPGEVALLDFRRLTVGRRGTLVLSGGNNPDSVLVVRVKTRLRARVGSRIVLDDGLDPSSVAILVQGDHCRVGERVQGAGTLMCPIGQVRMRQGTMWDGALIGGLGKVDIGTRVIVTGAPFGGDGN